MSALEPGLYRATVRGVADVTVLIGESGVGHLMDGSNHVSQRFITDARPLIVLDLTADDARDLVNYLEIAVERHLEQLGTVGRAVFTNVASQIEAQTKPARIPEPGLWGVVEAKITGGRFLRKALRVAVGEPQDWLLLTNEAPRQGLIAWDDLGSPEQVRPGVTS